MIWFYDSVASIRDFLELGGDVLYGTGCACLLQGISNGAEGIDVVGGNQQPGHTVDHHLGHGRGCRPENQGSPQNRHRHGAPWPAADR